MVYRKAGVFLYLTTQNTRKCPVHLPETVDDLYLSFYLELKSDDVLLQELFRAVDMSTKDLRVYNVRRGTGKELERCMSSP